MSIRLRMRAAAVAGLVFCGFMMPSIAADTVTYGSGPNAFSLATGSPGELGLLRLLGEAFAEKRQASL